MPHITADTEYSLEYIPFHKSILKDFLREHYVKGFKWGGTKVNRNVHLIEIFHLSVI